jgi:multiple antibiotic resistance protein
MVELLSLAIPLFFLMDFIGTVPVFVSLTRKRTHQNRLHVAIYSSIIAGAVVLLFAVLGEYILGYFELSIAALKVGGGLLLIYMAFEMIFTGQEAYIDSDDSSLIVSPLAIPMLAGPGSMVFAMIKFLELDGVNKLMIPLAILAVIVVGAATLAVSSYLDKVFGKEFIRGLEKLTAVLLAVIASEMVMEGIKLYFF